MKAFATRYTAAWCSQDPASVAEFFAQDGSLKINDGAPSVGRAAITEAVQSFMTDFPDMIVEMNGLDNLVHPGSIQDATDPQTWDFGIVEKPRPGLVAVLANRSA